MIVQCFSIIHGLFVSKTNIAAQQAKLGSGKHKTKEIDVWDLVTHGKIIELPKRLKKTLKNIRFFFFFVTEFLACSTSGSKENVSLKHSCIFAYMLHCFHLN